MQSPAPEIISRLVGENGGFPNNDSLPLLLIRQVYPTGEVSAELLEKRFTSNNWPAAWRNGLYDFHHYHTTAHEVLGVYAGWVRACFGGPGGEILRAEAGDVIIIPAGVAHCNTDQSEDFMVVGGYPHGLSSDMQYGKPDERPRADQNIRQVPLPETDPVFGVDGPLIQFWART